MNLRPHLRDPDSLGLGWSSQAEVVQRVSLDPVLRTPGEISSNTLDSLMFDFYLPLLYFVPVRWTMVFALKISPLEHDQATPVENLNLLVGGP